MRFSHFRVVWRLQVIASLQGDRGRASGRLQANSERMVVCRKKKEVNEVDVLMFGSILAGGTTPPCLFPVTNKHLYVHIMAWELCCCLSAQAHFVWRLESRL